MDGQNHSGMGAGVGAAALPWVAVGAVTFAPVTGALEQLGFVAACAGAAMLPDFDQGTLKIVKWKWGVPRFSLDVHGSTVTRLWGLASFVPAWLIGKIARGHRWGTHDVILGPLAFAVVFQLATLNRWTAWVALSFVIGLAAKALNWCIPGDTENTAWGNMAASLGAGWLLTIGSPWLAVHLPGVSAAWWLEHIGGGLPGWLPAAVWLGCITHLLGDFLTEGGLPVPIVGVLKKKRVRLPKALALKTGGDVEKSLHWPIRLAVIFVLLVTWAPLAHLRGWTVDRYQEHARPPAATALEAPRG